MKKLLFSFIILSFVMSYSFAGGGADTSMGDAPKKLIMYGTVHEEHVALLAQKFQEKTGIKTDFVRMSSGETVARLKAEENNMAASVWYGGPIDGYIAAYQEGVIEPYQSSTNPELKPQFISKDGSWTGTYVGYLGFVGNKKMLDERGIAMPQSWADLLKPEYKNEIVVAHPGSSGTAYTMLATVVQIMGEDKAMEYFKKFNGQVRQYTKSGSAPARLVGQGEASIAITFLHDAIKFKKEGFVDIIISAPSEGTGYEIGGVALLKNGPDQAAAKMFIDWILSKEGQELGKTVGSYQFLTNKNASPPEEAEPIKNTKLIDYDFDWAGQNKARLVERYISETNTTVPTK